MNDENWVVKSNALIEGKGKMTALEQKIITVLASEISPDDEDFKNYEFSIKEFINLAGTNETAIYKQIHESARRLMQKIITFKRGKRTITTAFLSSATTIDGEGKIILSFDPYLKPELLKLKKLFTQYQLKNILSLKGSHSIRLYELLKQYERIGKREFEVKVLKELLGVGEGYDRFDNFERRILKPTKNEINDKTDIWIDYRKIKEGRRIVKLSFEIESRYVNQEDEEIKIYKENGTFDFDNIRKNSGLENEKFSDKQILELYEIACEKTGSSNKSPFDYIKYYYNDMIQRGSIKTKFGYLKNSLRKDYLNFLIQVTFDDIL